MEVIGEVIGSSSDHLNIVKGKRTKRQRALSPLPNPPFNMIITTTSSSSAAAAAAAAGDDQNDHNNHNDYNDQNDQNDHITSVELYESTEEEEDMANCLILLAQGHSLNMGKRYGATVGAVTGTGDGGGGGARGGDGAVTEKFISRRFTEAATTTTGKAGFYVYECKTCNRCFPSFQALGGHRASHKKPKVNHEEKKALMLLDDDSAQFNTNGPSLTLQMSNRPMFSTSTNTTNNHNKSKVHECSICGSEFSSGQALGGHMRRHRTTNTATTMTATTTITAATTARDTILPDTSSQQTQKTKNVLSLDLNLPAPEDDRDGKFPFNSKQQSLIFSANSLVDCHY